MTYINDISSRAPYCTHHSTYCYKRVPRTSCTAVHSICTFSKLSAVGCGSCAGLDDGRLVLEHREVHRTERAARERAAGPGHRLLAVRERERRGAVEQVPPVAREVCTELSGSCPTHLIGVDASRTPCKVRTLLEYTFVDASKTS